MNRRDFLKATGVAGGWLLFNAALPKWIGETAGGFYAPVPEELWGHLHWHNPVSHINQLGTFQYVTAYALWAPPGETYGTLAEFSGVMPWAKNDALRAARRQNLHDSVRECFRRHHDPGWVLIRESDPEPRGVDEDGDPVFGFREIWRRAGYVEWLTTARVKDIGREVARGIVVAAA